jgi:hypothetical protein
MVISVGVAGEANAIYSKIEARKAKAAIRKMLKRTSTNCARYQIILDAGRAGTSIQKVAQRIDPDLLIVGTRGHGVLRRALLGSVAGHVMAEAHSDVLVIPERSTQASQTLRLCVESYEAGDRATQSRLESAVESGERCCPNMGSGYQSPHLHGNANHGSD